MSIPNFIEQTKPYAKAILAFFAPGLTQVAAIFATEGRLPNTQELLMALGVSMVTALAVYTVPNKPLS